MEDKKLGKLIGALRILVMAALVCNVLALFAVPVLVLLSPKEAMEAGMEGLGYLFGSKPVPEDYWPFTMIFFLSWLAVWESGYHAVLTVFLWICGCCTAVILWQAKCVLEVMLRGTPFVAENGTHLKKAAVCCFVISGAAGCRVIWGVFYYRSISPLLTYNFLFCPLFLMAGLLFLVMSALFLQAAQMREENDLTI